MPTFSSVVRIAACGASLAVTGCDTLICPAVPPGDAVMVSFINQRTGALLSGPVRGALHDGAYRDSLEAHTVNAEGEPWIFGAVPGREGQYVLRAEREGFLPVERAGIEVERVGCFATGPYLEVMLQESS